ncbi:MAG: winged helix-turn-helix transcriptional regulator [Actinomycetales bacterium]|nr:winged helix-turn-helix transcriptional regulator [Actinomycetales bacterium]
MHALDVLGDPVRRRLLELFAAREQAAGEASGVVEREFGISQPAVARHLRVLRESGFLTRRAEGRTRIYAVDPAALDELEGAVARYRTLWNQRLDALGTEIARGKHAASTHSAASTRPPEEQP